MSIYYDGRGCCPATRYLGIMHEVLYDVLYLNFLMFINYHCENINLGG